MPSQEPTARAAVRADHIERPPPRPSPRPARAVRASPSAHPRWSFLRQDEDDKELHIEDEETETEDEPETEDEANGTGSVRAGRCSTAPTPRPPPQAVRSSLFCQAHAPRAPAVWAGPEQKRTERSYSAGDVQRGLAAILTALQFNQTDLSAEKASLDCGHPSMARKVSAVPHVCCARAPVTSCVATCQPSPPGDPRAHPDAPSLP